MAMDPPTHSPEMASAPVISYVGPLTVHGISIFRDRSKLIIVCPPKRVDLILLAVGVLFVLGLAALCYVFQTGGWAGLQQVALVFGMFGVGLASVVSYLWRYARRPIHIEIGPEKVRLKGFTQTDSGQFEDLLLPRSKVYRVYYVHWAKALFFRTHGYDIVEIPMKYGSIACEEIARILRDELQIKDFGG